MKHAQFVFPNETLGYPDSRIVKASFRICSLEERKLFSASKCVLSISVGQPAHEGSKFLATIQLISSSFKSCDILVGDTLQRYTMGIKNSKRSEDALYQDSLNAGNEWLLRNKNIIAQLNIPYEITRWDDWLALPDFQRAYAKIVREYENNESYRKAIHESIDEYLARMSSGVTSSERKSIDYESARQFSLKYLLEECACKCLWVDGEYQFEVYPSDCNKALAATYDQFIKPKYPDLLRMVGLRFKKYPARLPGEINHSRFTERSNIVKQEVC